MGKIICLIGKSSSGKDTIYKKLLENENPKLNTIVLYTTRPIRAGEKDGVEYHFVTEEDYEVLKADGRIVEERAYHTRMGLWRYFTVWDESINLERQSYVVIGTLESYEKIRDYVGQDRVLPILIELDDGIRLERALHRERQQKNPKYDEMCRRFLADLEDFSPEKIENAGITKSFLNNDLDQCLEEITKYILSQI